ncbi:DNA cytosine methyltransferase [Pleurocapsales cyanobacterium LEGE 10410]|nr:DNA cytosine methyltransferase [Pleurocapsales cyanobacterium LEGE 10410]
MSTFKSVNEAASELKLTPQQVRTLCRNSTIQAEKIGNTWVIPNHSLSSYQNKRSFLAAENRTVYHSQKFKSPIALSFFSGAMGMDIGLEKAGIQVILACEIDKASRQTISLNKPDITLLGDIRDYSPQEIMTSVGLKLGDEIDLIVGGPPCQAFSTAGKRQAFNDQRGNIFLTYIDTALKIRPKFIAIENVRGLLSCPLKHRPHDQRGKQFPPLSVEEQKGGALFHIIQTIKQAGYSVSFNLYNAANFGTPQIRERVIVICSRDGYKIPYLEPTHSQHNCFDLPVWRTFREATLSLEHIQHQHLNFPEKRLQYYKMLRAGQNWRDLSAEIQPLAMGKSFYSGGGKTGFYRRLAWNKPAPTLLTHPAMPATDLCHPEENRPLSIQEYKRLQDFPDDWEIAGGLVNQYKQIGNAVPVNVGLAVGKHIIKYLQGQDIETYPNFEYSRYKNTDDVSWMQKFKQNMKAEQPEPIQYELPF